MNSIVKRLGGNRPLARMKCALGVVALLVLPQSLTFGADVVLSAINVDSNGNFIGLTWTSGELNAAVADRTTAYIGGLWSAVKTVYYDGQTGVGIVWRTVNGANGQWAYLYGVTYPNGFPANNVCKLVSSGGNFYCYALSTGYFGGSGNGVNGRVRALAISSADDVYVGGEFTQAGGFPYSSKIGVYRASGGWNTTYIFSVWDVVSGLSFNGNVLEVDGQTQTQYLWEVQFYQTGLAVTGQDAYWHTNNGYFGAGCYWTDN